MVRPRQVSDQQILAAARSAFLAEGPNVSTATIARALDISQAALFKRFKSKSQLMREALHLPTVPEWVGRVDAGPHPERPLADQLQELASALDAFFRELVPVLAAIKASDLCMEEFFADLEDPPPVRAVKALEGWFRRASEMGLARVEQPKAAGMAFMGALQVRVYLSHLFGREFEDVDPTSYVKAVVEAFAAALVAGGPLPKPLHLSPASQD